MADLKELILQNIVKPALSGIPPTVLAKVVGAKNKHFADITFPDFRRPQSDSAEEPTRWITLSNVHVGAPPGVVFRKLEPGEAVWVTFLGHDVTSARIIARAGRWNSKMEKITSTSMFEWIDPSEEAHDDSANVPNAASSR